MVIVMHKKYGKLVIIMHKLTAILGGYWRKFGGYLADILKEFATKYGGYCQKLENKMVVIPENI